MRKGVIRVLSLVLAAVMLFSVCPLPRLQVSAAVSDSYIAGREDDGHTVNTGLKNEIAENYTLSMNFMDGSMTKETVNSLLVENNGYTDANCASLTRGVSLTAGGLQLFNYKHFTTGSTLVKEDAASNRKTIYSLREDYIPSEVDSIEALIDIPYAPYYNSSTNADANQWDRAAAFLWFGISEEGDLIGMKIGAGNGTYSATFARISKETNSISLGQNFEPDTEGNTFDSDCAADKLRVCVSYIFDYTNGVYQPQVYFFGVQADGTETYLGYVKPRTTNTSLAVGSNIAEPTFGISVQTVNRNDYKFCVNFEQISVGFNDGFDNEVNFRKNHILALNLEDATLSYQDKSYIALAMASYESLPLREKGIFRRMNLSWNQYLTKINDLEAAGQLDTELLRDKTDYSNVEDDLAATGLRRFFNIVSEQQPSEYKTVWDKTLQKNVSEVRSRGIYLPKEYAVPYNYNSVTVTYKTRIEGMYANQSNSWDIYPWYVDSENYFKLSFSIDQYGVWRVIQIAYMNGAQVSSTGHQRVDTSIDPYRWHDVAITTSGNDINITFTQEGVEEPCSMAYKLPSERVAFAFGGCNGHVSAAKKDPENPDKTIWYYEDAMVYYADYEIYVEKSSYVPDGENNEIVSYYTGNTEVKGGDIVSITGEDLYKNVVGVQIARVPDVVDTNGTKYLFEVHYDKGSRKNADTKYQFSHFSSLPNNLTGDYVPTILNNSQWDWVETPILQYTEDSLNFAVPSSFERGVYAVRLVGRNSYNEDKVLYLNNADLDYYVADQGTVATQGGTIQLIGKATVLNSQNMYVQLRSATDTYTYTLQTTQYPVGDQRVELDSAYSVIVNLPLDIKKGEYEITVYNGYGDSTCISEPLKVTVDDSPMSKWPDYTVNVADLGATGVTSQNATPYFVTALTLLAENGGGTLYIPAGYYSLFHSLVIPENVIVKGENMEKTYLVISALHYKLGELPVYHFGYKGNVIFQDFTILASRAGNIFGCYTKEDTENVQWHNVRYQKWTFTGAPTDAAEGSGNRLYGYTATETYAMLVAELKTVGCGFWYWNNTTAKVDNWQATGLDIYQVGATNLSNPAYYGGLENARFVNSKIECAASSFFSMTGSNIIYSHNDFNSASGSVSGNNVYYSHNNMGNIPNNNHEIGVADEGLVYGADNSAFVTPLQGDASGRLYTLNKLYNRDQLKGSILIVVNGQGKGQIRYIVGNDGSSLTLDSPFEIAPTANSNVIISSRHNYYMVSNQFHDGSSPLCFFGNGMDIVYDGNDYDEIIEIGMNARVSMVLWYWSFVNCNFHDPKSYHTTGVADQTGKSSLYLLAYGTSTMRGITIRDNILDGYAIMMTINSGEATKDIIIQRNEFRSITGKPACQIFGGTNAEGAIYAENTFYDCDIGYSGTPPKAYNKYGSRRVLFLDTVASDVVVGDLNFDGEIDIKDVSLIRFYVVGLLEMSETQKYLADVYGDRDAVYVDLKDAAAIRTYLSTGSWPTVDMENIPTEPEDEEPTDPPVGPTDPTDPPVGPTDPTDPPVGPTDPTDPPAEGGGFGEDSDGWFNGRW